MSISVKDIAAAFTCVVALVGLIYGGYMLQAVFGSIETQRTEQIEKQQRMFSALEDGRYETQAR